VGSLSLENGGLLGRLGLDGLVWQFGTELLLMSRRHALLLLLGPLQDLGRNVARHTGILWLALGELALLLVLLLRVAGEGLGRWLLSRWGSSGVIVERLSAHHGLDLLHAHDLSGGRGHLGSGSRQRRGLALGGGLLGLEAPDVGTRLKLRNVLWVFVAFIARAIGLGGLRDRGSLLVLVLLLVVLLVVLLLLQLLLLLLVVLRDLLAGMKQHLLLLNGASNH